MAEILIKGMEPPRDCVRCYGRLGQYIDNCPINSKNAGFPLPYCKLSDCPITVLPRHGRLFDHDRVLRAVEEFQKKHNRAIKPEEFWRLMDRDIPCFMEDSNATDA